MVDAGDLKSSAPGRAGSSPAVRTSGIGDAEASDPVTRGALRVEYCRPHQLTYLRSGEKIKQSGLIHGVVGSNSSQKSASRDWSKSLANARRDVLVLGILIAAVVLLIWNGSELFQQLTNARNGLGPSLKIALIALTLNVALILFGWRRYVDLQHETEMRIQGEERAALIASTDGMTGLLNRKGFADQGEELRCHAASNGSAASDLFAAAAPVQGHQRSPWL